MNAAATRETIALGAITGMRSMAGPATLAMRHDSPLKLVAQVLAAAEMMADKTSIVGNRTDPIPLAGRALFGALVGGLLAREHNGNQVIGGLIGAASAVAAAHLAFQVRQRFAGSSAVGGVIEDLLAVGIGALYAPRAAGR